MENTLTFNDYVRMTVELGVPPLELKFFPYVTPDDATPVAYRTETLIRSVVLGELNEKDYIYVSDVRDCGIELFQHSIQHVINAYMKMAKAEKEFAFLSLRCAPRLPQTKSLYDLVSEVLKKNPSFPAEKLCLEFPAEILQVEEEKAVYALKDMQLLGVKTMIVDSGCTDFPLQKMGSVTPNYFLVSKNVMDNAEDRSHPKMVSALMDYIRSMGIDLFVTLEKQDLKKARRMDVLGCFVPNQEAQTLKEVCEAVIGEEQ